MPSRVLKVLTVIALIAGAVSYLVYHNLTPVVFSLGGGREWRVPLGLFAIGVFCLGGAFAGILALLSGFRRFLDDQRQRRRDRTWKRHLGLLIKGRELLAAHEFQAARKTFERMIAEDPENIVARVMLAETVAKQGNILEALEVLDQSRQADRRNLEFLFLGAELNAALGNYTAAYDNVAIALQSTPQNRRALELAASFAERLGRFEVAGGHLNELLRLASREDYDVLQERIATVELKRAQHELAQNPVAFRRALEDILRRHRDFPDALRALGALQSKEGRSEEAERSYARAYRGSGDTSVLREISELWLRSSNPRRAISGVQTAVEQREQRRSVTDAAGRLFLAALYLRLEMISEAEAELRSLATKSPQALTEETNRQGYTLLHANLLNRNGRFEEAFSALATILSQSGISSDLQPPNMLAGFGSAVTLGRYRRNAEEEAAAAGPSPRLSVP